MATITEAHPGWGDNPYIGPRTFSPAEAHKFFGRNREARNLIGMIVSHRTMLFYAQSGAGKSSLINAKVIPGLRNEGFEMLPVGRISGQNGLDTDVENIFVYNLISSLHRKKEEPPIFSSITLSAFLDNLVQVDGVFAYDDQYVYPEDAELKPRVLLIDQFEEILTTNTPFWEERDVFFQQLGEAMALDDQLWVVMAMREDFIAGLDPYRHHFENGLRDRFYMQQLDREAALEAIMKPAEGAKRPFCPDAADILVDNLREIRQRKTVGERFLGAYVEPVQLQAVCYQMWEKLKEHSGEQITVQDVEAYADVNEALINFYEDTIADTVANMDVSEPDLRNWFDVSLITQAGTRNMVYRGDETTGELPTLIADYVKSKFILRENVRPGGIWYELVHDRFVKPILRANREWRKGQPLIRLAERWVKADRDAAYLLGRRQLAEYTKRNENWKALGPLILAYAEASQKALAEADALEQEESRQQELEQQRALAEAQLVRAEEAEQAAVRQRKLTRVAFAIGAFALIASIIAFILLGFAQSQAEYAKEQTEYANEQATAAFYAQRTAEAAQGEAEEEARVSILARSTAEARGTALSESLDQQVLLLESLLTPEMSPSSASMSSTFTPTPSFQPTVTRSNSDGVPSAEMTAQAVATQEMLSVEAAATTQAAYLANQLTQIRVTQTAVAYETAEDIIIGYSVENQPITAVRLGNGSNNYLFVGGIHAGMAPSTVDLVEELISYYRENPTEIPSYATLYFISSLNPDSPYAPREIEGRLNANGVDINRNWGCAWKSDVVLGDEFVANAGGTEVFSEPETRALKEFVGQINPEAVIVWDAPSSQGFVSYGSGCDSSKTVSSQVGAAYALNTNYRLEMGSSQSIPGDITHWLDQQGIPATFVILPQATAFDLALNKQGVDAVLALMAVRPFERRLSVTEPKMQGDDVRLLQQRLFDLGYAEVDLIDGIYGVNTENVVIAFQQDNALDTDGIVGPVTWYVLFTPSRVETE